MPSTHEISVAEPNKPIVQGRPSRMICVTGVGKAPSDGPRSARSRRAQKRPYCSSGVPCSPYRSVRVARNVSIALGSRRLVDTRRSVCSTGSVGSSLGMVKVTVVPTAITTAHWSRRGRAYDFRKPMRKCGTHSGVGSHPRKRETASNEPVERLVRWVFGRREAGPVLSVLSDELLEADGLDGDHVLHPQLHCLVAQVEHLRVFRRQLGHLLDDCVELRELEALDIRAAIARGGLPDWREEARM